MSSDAGSAPPLLERRLLFVLGKGGSGKSTVAAALGLSAARRGKRALLVEVAGQDRLSGMFRDGDRNGTGEGEDVRELAPGLFGTSIDAGRATEEYLGLQLKVKPVVELLTRSRAFTHFTAAAPGLAELVTLGKIWHLAVALDPDRSPTWDVLVVDCPATGHGIALLEAAKNASGMAGGGPVHDQAARIHEVVTHPGATGIALVARPEDLSVTEAVEAAAALRARDLPVAAGVLNAVAPRRFTGDDAEPLRRVAEGGDAGARVAAEAALRHLGRQEVEEGHGRRLAEAVGGVVVELPDVVRPGFDRDALEVLADAVDAGPVRAGAAT